MCERENASYAQAMTSDNHAQVGPPCLNPEADSPLRLRCTPSPPTPKQAYFLSTTCRELLMYGGAAAGKSWALLAAALQFIDVPGYNALIVRQTLIDLKMPGGMIDMAHQWLDRFSGDTGATYNANDMRWTFAPTGATLTFGYVGDTDPADPHRLPGFASGVYQFVGFDCADEIASQYIYRWMLSRLRRPAPVEHPRDGERRQGHSLRLSEVPLRIRAIAGSLDPQNDPRPGTGWLRARYLPNGRTDSTPPSMTARYLDNPYIDAEAYEEALNTLPEGLAAALRG